MEYLKRIADIDLKQRLEAFGAVLLEGPKWCGKTTTAKQQAKSILQMQDPDNKAAYISTANIKPSLLLKGDKPRLLDEWQIAPVLWDAVRTSVDNIGEPGQYILTGSNSIELDKIMHSGIGRISKMKMYPMSLWESQDSNGKISIKDILSESDFLNINRLVIESVVDHKPFEVEVRFKNLINNEMLWVYGRSVPAFDDFGELKWLDGFFIDISEEKAAENQQKAAIEEIEKINEKLKEENKKAQDMALQIKSSNNTKEVFVNNIKKEVNTPITSIVELSKKLIKTNLPDEQLDYANIITSNSQSMLNIFDDILAAKEAGVQTADTPSDIKA